MDSIHKEMLVDASLEEVYAAMRRTLEAHNEGIN